MRNKKTLTLVVLFLMLAASVSGCIEVSNQVRSSGNVLGGAEVTEHVYLWGNDGPLTETYDVRMWLLGADVVNVKGLSRSEMESVLAKLNN